MAEALAAPSRASNGAPSAAEDDAVASYFEVHVRRGDRWVIDCTAPSAAEALAEAEDIARRPDVLAVKVINERYNRHTDQSAARVIFKLDKPERKRQPGPIRIMAAPRGAAPPPATPSPSLDPSGQLAAGHVPDSGTALAAAAAAARHLPPLAAPQPAPWLLFVWASLGLAVAATLLFVVLLATT